MAIKLMIDSAADISQSEAAKLGILMIPLVINFGNDEYLDGVDLLPEQFYEKLIESDELPKTSQVSPYRFEEVFNDVTNHGDELIVITISSKLSGTYHSALQASKKFSDKVYVVDSLNACIGERLLCEYALRLLKEDLTALEITEKLNEAKTKINVLAMLNTLEYLKKGGRISSVTAFTAGVLSIKPAVAIVDGEVKVMGKARGSKNANNLLTSLIEQKGGIDFSMPYGAVYSGLDNSLLKKYIKDSELLWKNKTEYIPQYILGGTIGTHIGPGAIGVAFFEK